MVEQCRRLARIIPLGMLLGGLLPCAGAAEPDTEVLNQLRRLAEQNEALERQLRRQQEVIDELSRRMGVLQSSADALGRATAQGEGDAPKRPEGFVAGRVRISGEGAIGLFHSQSDGMFPHAEFHVDEAKLFLEAPVWGEVYFFTELNLYTREEPNADLRAGELYLDVENLSRLWDQQGQLNLRLGRMDIPIGEEYLTRDAIDNPLVSHSIMDFWGVDEGVEVYGGLGKFSYVVAVQNGGHDALHDFNSDKSVAARVGLDPAAWLHASVSAMRTGDLDVKNDKLSELWLGSGFVRSLGSPATTTFGAEVLQGDVQIKWKKTKLAASGGVLHYHDNDPAAQNRRNVPYYYVEAQQILYKGFYAAARWSQMFAEDGFPIVGNGNAGEYGFSPELTTGLWRLSLGLGYRWSDHFLFKGEYSFEQGRTLSGQARNREDMVAGVLAGSF